LTAYSQAKGETHGPPATPRHPDSTVRRAATPYRVNPNTHAIRGNKHPKGKQQAE